MLKKVAVFFMLLVFAILPVEPIFSTEMPRIKLGNEVLMNKYHYLIEGKSVGLVTNRSGVNSRGESTVEILANDKTSSLVALYAPEHGLEGAARAGEYVESYLHPQLGIPVYSLYGSTRMPTEEMLKDVDVLLFDVQDIGARTYTYMSTLNYCMVAAEKYGKPLIVLDRPNPLGGVIVEGPVLEEPYKTFVGVDTLPMAHGMTAGELANFFNRNIGAELFVVPMEGYKRKMVFQDTGLEWIPTSPNIPDLDSLFGYMATGLGEGTGVRQADRFKWIGGKGLNAKKYAELLNGAGLEGVNFIPEERPEGGGVRLKIFDYHTFNPAKTGIYALAYAFSLGDFRVPKGGLTPQDMVMFDKVMGSNKIGLYLEEGLSPQQIEANYAPALKRFKEEREKYLIADYDPQTEGIKVLVDGRSIDFDSPPFIDTNNRLIVPLRFVTEALGAGVGWDSASRTVTIMREEDLVLFRINSSLAVVNGEEKVMDTVPVLKNNRTMVPARYISEYFGALVDWNPTTRIVSITTAH
ncbi:MAG: exo-beta-N-acetylmuramidase NamZ domain-containing protein [Dethiobacteria bacterium]